MECRSTRAVFSDRLRRIFFNKNSTNNEKTSLYAAGGCGAFPGCRLQEIQAGCASEIHVRQCEADDPADLAVFTSPGFLPGIYGYVQDQQGAFRLSGNEAICIRAIGYTIFLC